MSFFYISNSVLLTRNLYFIKKIYYKYEFRGNVLTKGSLRQESIPTKTRFRSVPDVTDTKFAAPLLAELLINGQASSKGLLLEYCLASASLLAILGKSYIFYNLLQVCKRSSCCYHFVSLC